MELFLQGSRYSIFSILDLQNWRKSEICYSSNIWLIRPKISCGSWICKCHEFWTISKDFVTECSMYKFRIDFRGMKFHSHQTRQTIHFPCWKISLSLYVNIILAGCYWRGKHLIWTPQNHLLEFKKMGNKWCTTLSYILHIILQPKRLPVIHNNHSISATLASLRFDFWHV